MAGQLSGILGQGSNVTATAGQGNNSGGGAPINVTDITSAGSTAGNAIQSGLTKSSQALANAANKDTASGITAASSDTAQITGTATSLTQYGGNLVYDVLPRIVTGLAAVLLIGTGLWMIGKQVRG